MTKMHILEALGMALLSITYIYIRPRYTTCRLRVRVMRLLNIRNVAHPWLMSTLYIIIFDIACEGAERIYCIVVFEGRLVRMLVHE